MTDVIYSGRRYKDPDSGHRMYEVLGIAGAVCYDLSSGWTVAAAKKDYIDNNKQIALDNDLAFRNAYGFYD